MNTIRPIDHAAEMASVDRVAKLLDSQFRLFGIRFGYDSLLGLIPGVGDVLTAVPSAWMIWKAHSLGIPNGTKARMAANWGADFVIGGIPIVGDIFDIGFKANLRNAALLREELGRMAEREGLSGLVQPTPN